jgi:hypothetical protein
VYNTENRWVYGLCPSPGILNNQTTQGYSYISIFTYFSEFLATDSEVRARFPALPNFLRSGSVVSTIEELLGRKSSGSCLENREHGRRDPSR